MSKNTTQKEREGKYKGTRVLVVDNYDSFVYVLVQYLGYLGVEPIVHRNDTENFSELIEELAPDAILISPGPGRPENAGYSIDIIKNFSEKLPILGVCLGHQCIATAFGGDVVRDTEVTHGKTSEIHHNSSELFDDIGEAFVATRYHSLLVDPDSVPEELEVTAKTKDGRIMALSHVDRPTYGIQFHPESVLTTEGMGLLENFLKGAVAS